MISWAGDHHDFAVKVSKETLELKNLAFPDYIADMALNTQPYDHIAILLTARMCKIHVTIFQNDYWVNSYRSPEYSRSKLVLVYRGKGRYDMLRQRKDLHPKYFQPDAYFEPDDTDLWHAHLKRIAEEEAAAKAKGPKFKFGTGKPKPKPKSAPKVKQPGKARAVPTPDVPVSTVTTRNKAKKALAAAKSQSRRSTATSRKAGSESLPMGPTAKATKPHAAKPIILPNVKLPKRVPSVRKPKSSAAAVATKKSIKTAKGKIAVRKYHLRKPKPKVLCLKCPRPKCKQKFPSHKDLNTHLRQYHPTFHYTCKYCNRKYQTYNGWYKHEAQHRPSKWVCEFCGKELQFQKQLSTHRKTHTGKNLYPCTHCGKTYTTNLLMKRHAVEHTGSTFQCDQCAYSGKTPGALHQHQKGEHGPGWIALCGWPFKWPSKRNRHQRHCQQCKAKKVDAERARLDFRKAAMEDDADNRKGKPGKKK